MPKPVIDALDALLSIRSGMSDTELMEKYNVSAKGLQSLLTKLVSAGVLEPSDLEERASHSRDSLSIFQETRSSSGNHVVKTTAQLLAKQAAHDIRSGMADAELMDKYRVSARGLQKLFRELRETGAVDRHDLERRTSTDETVDLIEIIQKLGMDRTQTTESGEVPRHCIACGAPQTAEYEECPACGANIPQFRSRQEREKRVAQATWHCPACARPQPEAFEECPVCGVIVSKYKKG
ncbi:MAG TPA: zinc ribbon domain-containing protein [Desulfomonilaceae bacterium]|nr:zinc ribbon domain-containing protein [Desulfomonilaceae bacterium]